MRFENARSAARTVPGRTTDSVCYQVCAQNVWRGTRLASQGGKTGAAARSKTLQNRGRTTAAAVASPIATAPTQLPTKMAHALPLARPFPKGTQQRRRRICNTRAWLQNGDAHDYSVTAHDPHLQRVRNNGNGCRPRTVWRSLRRREETPINDECAAVSSISFSHPHVRCVTAHVDPQYVWVELTEIKKTTHAWFIFGISPSFTDCRAWLPGSGCLQDSPLSRSRPARTSAPRRVCRPRSSTHRSGSGRPIPSRRRSPRGTRTARRQGKTGRRHLCTKQPGLVARVLVVAALAGSSRNRRRSSSCSRGRSPVHFRRSCRRICRGCSSLCLVTRW